MVVRKIEELNNKKRGKSVCILGTVKHKIATTK